MNPSFIQTCIPAFMRWPVPDPDLPGDDPMQTWQDRRCALCGADDGTILDHDHWTNLTRGYLCQSCNVREGRSFEAVFLLWRAGLNPARVFGWEELYDGLPPESEWRHTSWDTMRRGAEAAGRIG